MRIKYDCPACGKQFVSKNNLERHQTSHNSTQENVCEHCNKQFVSENRLRIHKENHCKKAGDISKFYRSDVTVWKCIKCNQVFATPASAAKHTDNCNDILNTIQIKHQNFPSTRNNSEDLFLLNQQLENLTNVIPNVNKQQSKETSKHETPNFYVEKVLTELLLQCEYCNRTYSDRNLLLTHQRKHTTEINYQCVTCKESFDSYTFATKHWMTKCSDEANLFYLPKMTYCEYCDRTFKSHEILYTHKIKKKHYTPKKHIVNEICSNNCAQSSENKDVLVKLIEDVLTTMDVSLNKNNEDKNEENSLTNDNQVSFIKNEFLKEVDKENAEPEKKKRGRKRKWLKKAIKPKRPTFLIDEGYKYQCERCVLVFDTVLELETHREKEHASNFSCEECGQVFLYFYLESLFRSYFLGRT